MKRQYIAGYPFHHTQTSGCDKIDVTVFFIAATPKNGDFRPFSGGYILLQMSTCFPPGWALILQIFRGKKYSKRQILEKFPEKFVKNQAVFRIFTISRLSADAVGRDFLFFCGDFFEIYNLLIICIAENDHFQRWFPSSTRISR